jgi:hypothetical protein
MPEAETALRLAKFLLALPNSGAMASVAIDHASLMVADTVIFDIGRFLVSAEWEPIKASRVGRESWAGAYRRGDKAIRVHSRRGQGDVIATVGGRRIIAECKKGPLIRRSGNIEASLLTAALGQALLFDVSAGDVVVAAVPDAPVFRSLAETWRHRALVRQAGIRIALVARDGTVSGLDL